MHGFWTPAHHHVCVGVFARACAICQCMSMYFSCAEHAHHPVTTEVIPDERQNWDLDTGYLL